MHTRTLILAFATLCLNPAFAHPGDDPKAEAIAYEQALAGSKRNLNHCAESLARRGITGKAVQRRAAMIDTLKEKRGLKKRGVNEHPNVHAPYTDPDRIFVGNNSCTLAPEDYDSGPYWVEGEYVRRDLVEDQAGIPMHIDMQLINSATCEPVVGAFIDIWNCNATGIYSGEGSEFEGNADGYNNWGTTFLRGIQPTDSDGVAQFDTLFPGHYQYRATHLHTIVHHSSKDDPAIPNRNHTLMGNTASHVGQIFFDDDLRAEVESTAPYNTNKIPITSNANDTILQSSLAKGGYPYFQYARVGDRIEDGLIVWISVGINVTYSRTVCAIATLLADGSGHVPSGSTPPNCIASGASPL